MHSSFNTYFLGAIALLCGLSMMENPRDRFIGGAIALIGLLAIATSLAMPYHHYTKEPATARIEHQGSSNCGRIIVYTMEGCPWCTKLKAELDQRGIKYTEFVFYPKLGIAPPQGWPHQYPTVFINGENVGGYSERNNWINSC